MEKRLAIVIAVEKYADTRIRTVKYAEADAEGFAKALETMASLFSIPASHFPILTVFAGAAFFSFCSPDFSRYRKKPGSAPDFPLTC